MKSIKDFFKRKEEVKVKYIYTKENDFSNFTDVRPYMSKDTEDILTKDLNKMFDAEKQFNKQQSNAEIMTKKDLMAQLTKSLVGECQGNPNRFMGNWMSNITSDNSLKYMLLYRLGRNNGWFTCLTYQQELLKNLYDSSLTMKDVLRAPIQLAFSTLRFSKKNKDEEEDLEFKDKCQYLQQELLKIIEYVELTGGAIITKEKDILKINEKTFKNVKEEDFNYKNKDFFPVRSINRPCGFSCQGVLPFGLSWFENKIELLEMDKQTTKALQETMIRQTFLVLQIENTDFWKTLPEKERELLMEKLQNIANRGTMASVVLPSGTSADFRSCNTNLQMFQEVQYFVRQQLSGGIPMSYWKGESSGSINIGNGEGEVNIMISQLKETFRSNYEKFINNLANVFLGEEVNIVYNDIVNQDGAKEIESIKNLSDMINTLSSVVSEDEAINDIKTKLLNKLNEKTDAI